MRDLLQSLGCVLNKNVGMQLARSCHAPGSHAAAMQLAAGRGPDRTGCQNRVPEAGIVSSRKRLLLFAFCHMCILEALAALRKFFGAWAQKVTSSSQRHLRVEHRPSPPRRGHQLASGARKKADIELAATPPS